MTIKNWVDHVTAAIIVAQCTGRSSVTINPLSKREGLRVIGKVRENMKFIRYQQVGDKSFRIYWVTEDAVSKPDLKHKKTFN